MGEPSRQKDLVFFTTRASKCPMGWARVDQEQCLETGWQQSQTVRGHVH